MKQNNLLAPLVRKIDQIIFGFEEINEVEQKNNFIDSDNDEEFDVERSSN